MLVIVTYTITPCVEFIVSVLVKCLKLYGCCCCKADLRTSAEYYEVHAGPQYEFFWRHAIIQMVLFVAFILGFVYPFVIFVTFASLMFFFIFNKITLSKWYRSPKVLSEKFNEGQLENNMRYLVMLYIASIFVIFCNFDLIEATPSFYDDSGSLVQPLDQPSYTAKAILVFFIALAYFNGFKCCGAVFCTKKSIHAKVHKSAKLQKYLSNINSSFISSLSVKDKNWLLQEELNLNEQSIFRLKKESLDALRDQEEPRRKMLKMSFYDLLADQDYCNSFEYLARNTSLEDAAKNEHSERNDDYEECPIDHY